MRNPNHAGQYGAENDARKGGEMGRTNGEPAAAAPYASGRPGRPHKNIGSASVVRELRELMTQECPQVRGMSWAKAIARRLAAEALLGHVDWMRTVLDRVDGKVPETRITGTVAEWSAVVVELPEARDVEYLTLPPAPAAPLERLEFPDVAAIVQVDCPGTPDSGAPALPQPETDGA